MNRSLKELVLTVVIVLSVIAGTSATLAWSSPVGQPTQATQTTQIAVQIVEDTIAVEQSRLESFAKAYEAHLIKTWVDTTNWNLWMSEAVEFEKAKAAEARRLREEAERQAVVGVQQPAPVASVQSSSSGQCGGNLPPCCVMHRESGGSLTAQNPTSSASGKWQFINSTWNGYGGYPEAWMAPESVQDAKAAELWAGGGGASHWGGGC